MRTRNHPVEPEELMAYLDGELPHDRAAEASAHLEHCAECQTLAAELREVSRKLAAWQVETPEAANTEGIESAFAECAKKPMNAGQRIHWKDTLRAGTMLRLGGFAAAAVLLLLVMSVPVLRRSREPAFQTAQVRETQRAQEPKDAGNRPVEEAAPWPSDATGNERSGSGLARTSRVHQRAEAASTTNEAPPPLPAAASPASVPADQKVFSAGGARDGSMSDKSAGRLDSQAAPSAKQEPSANQTVEVAASAATVEVSPAGGASGQMNDGLSGQGARARRAPAQRAAREADDKPGGPLIVHTAQISLTISDFDQGRSAIEEVLKRHGGYVGSLNVSAPPGSGRTLNATLRVPAVQLQETLAELKKLGRVTAESQSGEEVTQQYVDLEARLSNAHNSEQRLKELLRDRTGKLKDVMEVELQIGQVREQIETMEAERKDLGNRVDYATLVVTLAEEYKAELQVVPVSTWTRISNAAVEGYHTMAEGLIDVALFLASVGPSLLLWALILFLPVRWMWKRYKPRAMAA